MNYKLILSSLILLSLPLYGQDITSLELSDEGVETNPLESAEAAPVEADFESEFAEADAPETKVETVDTKGSAVDEFVPPANAEAVANVPESRLETDIETRKRFNPRESHWYTTFSFEGMEYDLPFEYDGEKEDFGPEKRKLYGGRLGFGGEFYLGAGFMTSTRIEGYYMGTLFEKAKTVDEDISEDDVATVKKAGQIYGIDVVQTLSYLWDFKTKNPFMDEWAYLTIEPFIEAGIGRAKAFNKKDYRYETNDVEEYDHSFTDELTNVKLGAGINLTSSTGFFFFLKATQNRYDITDRKAKGYFYRNGQAREDVDSNPTTKLDPIMVYSLGGGYKF